MTSWEKTRTNLVKRPKRGSQWPIEAIIPSFREDDEEAGSDDAAIQEYLDQLPEEPYILFVGALRRVKGVQQLLDAYEQLEGAPPLVLIGTWENDSPHQLPPGVHVVPNLPHAAVMAAWDRALFGVIPSLWPEPLGSVVYEGMSRGKAVIGTTPGGHTDMIVDGVTGLLVPPGDVDALRAAMQTLLDDPELCVRFGQAGRVRARLFTAEVNVPRFEQLYRQLDRGKSHQAEPAWCRRQAQRRDCQLAIGGVGRMIHRSIPVHNIRDSFEREGSRPVRQFNKIRSHLRTPLYRNGYALLVTAVTTSLLGIVFWAAAVRFYTRQRSSASARQQFRPWYW